MPRELTGADRVFFKSLLTSMGMDGLRASDEFAPPRRLDWRMTTIPDGAALGKATFADLVAVVKACGDDELVIADTFSPQPNQHLIACSLDYYEFKNALASDADFTTFDVSVVGRSARWVMILKGLDIGFLFADASAMQGDFFGPGLRH
jgi:hypothetical protein